MIITWYGQSCVRLQNKDSVLVFDPYSKVVGFSLPRIQANIVCVSHDHDDHNNIDGIGGDPFVITTPGEYEVGGVFVYGMQTFHDATEGKERGVNNMYTVEMEDLHITHLGDLGATELTKEQLEQIEGTDILFIPVGGVYTISGEEAAKLTQQIEPRMVIPMHYKVPKLKYKLDGPETFLKAVGGQGVAPVDQLKITKKDLPQEDMQTVVLTPKL